MKQDIDLTKLIREKQESKKKEFGKYYVSELWGIVNGYMSVKEVLEGKKFTDEAIIRMWKGTWKHLQIQDLFNKEQYEIEKRIEYKINGIVLVGKIDIFDNKNKKVLEIKTSDYLMEKSKSWHNYQVKCYLSMLGVDRGYIYQPIVENKSKVILKAIGEIQRNDDWFNKQIELLKSFHTKVVYYKTKLQSQ